MESSRPGSGEAFGGHEDESLPSQITAEMMERLKQDEATENDDNFPERSRQLEQALLALGGKRVVNRGHDAHAARLLARGQLFDQPVKLRRGEPNACHSNAAELWARNPARRVLVTGYALNRGCWRQHSWVIQQDTLLETTCQRDRYFGLSLNPAESLKLFFENCPGGFDSQLDLKEARSASLVREKF